MTGKKNSDLKNMTPGIGRLTRSAAISEKTKTIGRSNSRLPIVSAKAGRNTVSSTKASW